jgi:hypothetical protein
MSEAELDLLEGPVPEPTAWELAFAIGIEVDPEADRPALDELADAVLVWATEATLERLTDGALEHVWNDELAQWIREGLVELTAKDDWDQAAAAALVEFDRDPRAAGVSREVIRCLAMQLGGADQPGLFCLDCLAEALVEAPPGARRELARRAAVLARRNAAVPDEELREALTGLAVRAPTERLGTEARRAAVRARLGRLGELGRDSLPVLAAELRAIATEPLPIRAEDDDVWNEVCTLLLADVARPESN